MVTIIDITQNELARALANEESDAKIKLRRLSHANLVEHVKNIPYKMINDSETNIVNNIPLSVEERELNISSERHIELADGGFRPINVKEEKLESIRKNSDILISTVSNENTVTDEQVDYSESSIEEEVVENAEPEITQDEVENEVKVDDVSTSFDISENSIDISEYATKIQNETKLLKEIKEEVSLAQQKIDNKNDKVSKLSIEISELEKREIDAQKREADIQRRNIELDRQIVAAYQEQSRIQALQREEQRALLEELAKKEEIVDNKILEFNSKKSEAEKRIIEKNESIAKEEERIAKKEAILAAILPQNNITNDYQVDNNVIQFSNVNDDEEKVKRIA